MGEWKTIPGFEKPYEVSDTGQVRDGNRELGQWPNSNGYMLVRLSRPRAQPLVHRLVAEAFIANPHRKPFVNHIDNNPTNNRASNLEWCTQKENLAHAARQGRMQRDFWVGKRSPQAALRDECARQIRLDYAAGRGSWSQLASKYGTNKRTVGRIVHGEAYRNV